METPCLLLDKDRMERNISRLKDRLRSMGVKLRPHMKTAKSIEVGRVLMEGTDGRITVSTLKEAEQFARAGVTDMIYAVGISPQKLARVHRIRSGGVQLKVILDSMEQAAAIARYVQETGDPIEVLIEIDCDGHRSGVKFDDEETILSIAAAVRQGGGRLVGVLTHAGESYAAKSRSELVQAAERERYAVVSAAGILRAAGVDVSIVSVGSTPTAHFAEDLTGVTEVRAGVFVFFDLVMNGIGVCHINDIAISVLTTVIGHQAEKGWIIVDAGWMAMSRDLGMAGQDQGYGLVCDADGRLIDGLFMASANQEHGILASRLGAGKLEEKYPVGTLLRVLPNHACATAAQYQEYQVISGNRLSGTWSRFNGW